MNAQQRRTAYRKIDRMVGKIFRYVKPSGKVLTVTALGRTTPVREMGCNSDHSTFSGVRPSVHRIRCSTPLATISPRLSSLSPV